MKRSLQTPEQQTPPLTSSDMRYCALCDIRRPIQQFPTNELGADGLYPFCLRHLTQEESDARARDASRRLSLGGISPRTTLRMEMPKTKTMVQP